MKQNSFSFHFCQNQHSKKEKKEKKLNYTIFVYTVYYFIKTRDRFHFCLIESLRSEVNNQLLNHKYVISNNYLKFDHSALSLFFLKASMTVD